MSDMIIITSHQHSQDVVERYIEQYGGEDKKYRKLHNGKTYGDSVAGIKVIKDPTPDNIAEYIGNKSWTHPECNSCNQKVDYVIRMHVNYDDEDITY